MKRQNITRRDVLAAGGAAAMATALPAPAQAQMGVPGQMDAAIRSVFGEAVIRKGKVVLDLPPLVENGNVVSVSVSVDSPMTATDHVKAIHIFNEKNPLPDVLGVRLGPRAGRASFSTRIRLADTQTITAIAEVSDGTFWSASVEVIVTLAACVEVL